MKKKSILSVCLCFVFIYAMLLTACSSKTAVRTQGSAADEVTEVTQSTSYETSESNTTSTEPTSTATTSTSETATTAPTKAATTAPAENKPSQNNSNNNNNSNSGSTETKPMTCVVTVGGKDYTAKSGDILTYTYYLKTPKQIECVQASVKYTPECLQLVEDDMETQLPVVYSGAIVNGNNQGVFNYNAVNISGFDFTSEAVLITLRFKVIYGGSGSITNAIQYMDEKGAAVSYFDDFKMNDSVNYRETLK